MRRQKIWRSLCDGILEIEILKNLIDYLLSDTFETLSFEEKTRELIEVWDLFYKINEMLIRSVSESDNYKIDNVSWEKALSLSERLYYVVNWLSFDKEIDKEYVLDWFIEY